MGLVEGKLVREFAVRDNFAHRIAAQRRWLQIKANKLSKMQAEGKGAANAEGRSE